MNKLSDNEIKKALECWASGKECEETCECFKYDTPRCDLLTAENALDLINRLEAEKETYKDCFEKCFKDLKNAHTEARKEFAKLLIDKSKDGVIHISDIPDYVREMDE